jgi:uncharacterized protein YjdB
MKTFLERIMIIGMLICVAFFSACQEEEEKTENKAIAVRSVSASPTVTTLAIGSLRVAKVTVFPDGANQQVYWKSSNPDVATVAAGTITGIAEGKATITVNSVEDASKIDSIEVTVTSEIIAVEQVTLEPAGALTIYIDDVLPLNVTVSPATAYNQQVLWKNSAPEVISLVDGVITGLARGTAVITAISASDATKTATLNITVTDRSVAVEEVKASINKIAMASGKTKTVTTTVLPDDATDKTLAWESSNTAVATVANGVITAVSEGTAVITVSSTSNPDKKATVAVTVSNLSGFPTVISDAAGFWLFNASLGQATIGQDLTPYKMAGNKTVGSPSTDGFALLDDAGKKIVRVSKQSYFNCVHGISPKSGETAVNEYSLMFDIKIPALRWYTFYQTNLANSDDGDLFINASGKIGCGSGIDYSANVLAINVWHRVVISAKMGVQLKVYLNGTLFHTGGIANLTAGSRWSLSPNGILLLGDEDGDDNECDIAGMAIWDHALTDTEISSLGGVN